MALNVKATTNVRIAQLIVLECVPASVLHTVVSSVSKIILSLARQLMIQNLITDSTATLLLPGQISDTLQRREPSNHYQSVLSGKTQFLSYFLLINFGGCCGQKDA